MPENKENNYRLLSDEPILETERSDNLKFKASAEVLARAALHTKSPMTIGVFGTWGSGKTSLMRLMHAIVEEEGTGDNAAVPVWFNAWQYEREDHLIVPLIATIARDIKQKQEQWDKITLDAKVGKAAKVALNKVMDGGRCVHDALRAVLYGISMKGKLGVPMVGEVEISTSMKDMIERYEAVTQDTFMARSLYFNAFDELRKLSHDEKIKKPQIVVFIDDLDRCFPEQAVRLLESVKLILHQPNFAFVLGIYPQIVEEFIRNKYAAQYPLAAVTAASGADNDESRNRMNNYLKYFNEYLDKIVQVRHYVPERQPDQMQDYIQQLLGDAGVTSEFLVEGVNKNDLLNLIAEVGRRNPRDIVRKINGLIVKWRISIHDEDDDRKYDLLAGLINEAIADRVSRDKQVYEQFIHRLAWTTDSEGEPTYGEVMAQALKELQGKELEGELRINHLRRKTSAEKSPTMKSLIDVLNQDEPLCNVLSSEPGRKWLSDKAYREETRETFQEKDSVPKSGETERKQESKTDKFMDKTLEGKGITHLLPGLNMIKIPEGEFQMGSEKFSSAENPIHTVKLSEFELSATPITQAQYEEIMGSNPSRFKGPDRPVESVSWEEAMIFCEQLTKKDKASGYRFTLPTEAQWECACRAGTPTEYCFGDDEAKLDKYAWYKDNSEGRTQSVGGKEANPWGFYDMHGNVYEWCLDWFDDDYYSRSPESNPTGPERGSFRVIRGGSWLNPAERCRSAYRSWDAPSLRLNRVGFRVARSSEH